MKKIMVTLMLASISTSGIAEWAEVGEADGGVKIYSDFSTIRKTDDKVKMWELWDYKAVQEVTEVKFLSSKGQTEYDCKEEQSRILASTWFTGNMGAGQPVYSNSDPLKWKPVAPGSVGQTLWKIACGRIAQWTRVDVNDELTQYADYSTIRKAGNRVKMWTLFDHKSVQEDAAGRYLSVKIQREYDCKDKQIRVVAFSFFSENMGDGELVFSDSDSTNWKPKWELVVPGGEAERTWKRACSKL